MANYVENPDSVIQNLEDAGCDMEMVAEFMKLGIAGNRQNQLKLLEQHRNACWKKYIRMKSGLTAWTIWCFR